MIPRRLFLVTALLLTACHLSAPTLPWRTFSEMQPDATSVTIGACRTGPILAMSLTHEGRDYFLMAKENRWLIILFTSEGKGEWAWVGIDTDPPGGIVPRESLSVSEISVKYPGPCDYLDWVSA